MTLRTTIIVNETTSEKLLQLSQIYDVTIPHIVHVIIHLLCEKQGPFLRDRITTQYQRFDSEEYFLVHLRLSENDLDFAKDLRRFFCASFSLLIAEALILLYDEILIALRNLDNYPCSCHVKVYFREKGTSYWKHIWGTPKREEIALPKTE